MYRLNTSEGTPKPATWPMWRGPLAYGQATAERMWVMTPQLRGRPRAPPPHSPSPPGGTVSLVFGCLGDFVKFTCRAEVGQGSIWQEPGFSVRVWPLAQPCLCSTGTHHERDKTLITPERLEVAEHLIVQS